MSTRHAVHSTREFCVSILEALGSTFSLECAECIRTGSNDSAYVDGPSVRELLDQSSDWRDFFVAYQASELLSKADFLNLAVNRESVAIEKFLESESSCFETNTRFVSRDSVPFPGADVSSIFHRARRKIARILGAFSWDEAGPLMAFGPGAAVGVTRAKRHVVYKFGLERPTVTGECATFADALIGASPQWSKTVPDLLTGKSEGGLLVVQGSRITTVPKNAKTDRVIAIEPLMNMFVQKGIGGVIRRKLRTVGIDLDSQARNQALAHLGSVSGLLATIDLKAASDSIARGLVDWLLPEDWLLAMKVCRSKYCVLPSGDNHFLQKFSSMGNGFTFELETLIFWALLDASTEHVGETGRDNSVYGDDIICPVSVVRVLTEVLSFAGFTLNEKKSFWSGPFRESCGKHYFLGRDVTPFYVRKHVGSDERKLWLANSLKRLAHRLCGVGYGCDARLRNVYDDVVACIDRRYSRLSIPDGFGDGGLVRDFDEARPSKASHGIEGYRYTHLKRDYRLRKPSEQPALTTSLFYLGKSKSVIEPRYASRSSLRHHALRFRESLPVEIQLDRYRLRLVKSVAPRWCNLGPWVESL